MEREELLKQLQTSSDGLTTEEAKERLRRLGPNLLKPKKRTGSLTLLLAQFKSPIIIILTFAASLSFVRCVHWLCLSAPLSNFSVLHRYHRFS